MKIEKQEMSDFKPFKIVIEVASERERSFINQFFSGFSINEITDIANNSVVENAITNFKSEDGFSAMLSYIYEKTLP